MQINLPELDSRMVENLQSRTRGINDGILEYDRRSELAVGGSGLSEGIQEQRIAIERIRIIPLRM